MCRWRHVGWCVALGMLGTSAWLIAQSADHIRGIRPHYHDGIATSVILPIAEDLSMGLGSATTTSFTITTDGTGNAEVVLPVNSIGILEQQGGAVLVTYCGELAENGTIYFGPVPVTTASPALDGTDCDAQTSATENTADAVFQAGSAQRPMHMWCVTNATLGAAETITVTLRGSAASIAANATDFACTIAEAGTTCQEADNGDTSISGSTPTAIRAVMQSDNGDGEDLKCVVAWNIGG